MRILAAAYITLIFIVAIVCVIHFRIGGNAERLFVYCSFSRLLLLYLSLVIMSLSVLSFFRSFGLTGEGVRCVSPSGTVESLVSRYAEASWLLFVLSLF
jgi:hypothetical protein